MSSARVEEQKANANKPEGIFISIFIRNTYFSE